MIKAPRASKVKTLFALLPWVLAASLFSGPAAFPQTEGEVQAVEEQEFGLEKSDAKPAAPRSDPRTSPQPSAENPQKAADSEEQRPIDAEEFRVKLKRKSSSGRVLLLEDSTENKPKPGKILLLKEGEQDIVAVRVLKNYPGKFAAKIVLAFGQAPAMEKEYRALKKLGDKLMEMIREEEKKRKRAGEALSDEELAKEVAPDDLELDRGIPQSTPTPSPEPKPKAKDEKAGIEPLFTKNGEELTMDDISADDDEDLYGEVSVQENRSSEPYRSALTVEYAGLKNVDKKEDFTSYNAIGLRYAYNFAQRALFKKGSTTDLLSAELGLFYYKIVAFKISTDQITMTPFVLTAKYGLLFGEALSLYGYGGVIFNSIASQRDIDLRTTSIGRTRPVVGLGAMMKIGPAWAIRGDFGSDMLGVGAVLKF